MIARRQRCGAIAKTAQRVRWLKQLSVATAAELSGVCKGFGPAKAAALMAAFELGRRVVAASDDDGQSLPAALRRVQSYLSGEQREFIVSLYLDDRGKVIEEDRLSYGGIDGATLDLAHLLRRAVRVAASSVVLIHNHPDGDALPSQDDLELTKEVRQRLEVLDMQLEEHYIVAGTVCRPIGRQRYLRSETGLL